MIDVGTKQPVMLADNDQMGPYFRVSAEHTPALTAFLQQHGVYHWVQGGGISENGGPAIGFVFTNKQTDYRKLRLLLDNT
jgi:hypothetical protein